MKPIRITEVNKMAQCERAWWYSYGLEIAYEPSKAMTKGTLFHALWSEWWDTGLDNEFYFRALKRVPNEDQARITEEIAADASWMIERYDALYGPDKHEWEVVANELELEAEVGGLLLQGRCDGLLMHAPSERLYLAECKTMSDWRRLDILTVDPQVTQYYMLAKAMGYDVWGVLYDAAKTYRWTRDEAKHPPAHSFQRLFLDRTAEQCEEAVAELRSFNDRRDDLMTSHRFPIRNISAQTCNGCFHRPQCWDELAFPQATGIVIEDE